MEKLNLAEQCAALSQYWQPKTLGGLNDNHIKIAKMLGEYHWHCHEAEDEMFLVIKGILRIRMRSKDILLNPGECFVVPKGTEHQPIAEQEVHVLMIEPKTTVSTGS